MMRRRFNQEDFREAFQVISLFWKNGYVNRDLNGLTSPEAALEWINGNGAMHPLGSWMIGVVKEINPENFDYDFFNLPSMPGKKGDQSSILGLNVGFILNPKSSHQKEALEFLKYITRKDIIARFTSVGELSLIKDAFSTKETNTLTLKLGLLLNQTSIVVSPPDTGYNLNVANAFYHAVAKVLGGVTNPASALEELDINDYFDRKPTVCRW